MTHELYLDKHPSDEKQTILIKYDSSENKEDHFEIFGCNLMSNVRSLIVKPFSSSFYENPNINLPSGKYTIELDWKKEIDKVDCKCFETENKTIIEEVCRRVYNELEKDLEKVPEMVGTWINWCRKQQPTYCFEEPIKRKIFDF